MEAISSGDVKSIRKLTAEFGGVDVTAAGQRGDAPLMMASQIGYVEVASSPLSPFSLSPPFALLE